MLLGVVSLIAGSTTGVPMSPGGMEQTKLQRCRLNTQQQHTQQPVPRPPRFQSITPQFMIPRAATPNPEV
jgi:hypothetical protein